MLLRNGISLDQALRTVNQLAIDCGNLKSELSGGRDPWRKYVDWAATCERQLRGLFADPGGNELRQVQHYMQNWDPATHVAKLIAAEIDVQVERLEGILARLR